MSDVASRYWHDSSAEHNDAPGYALRMIGSAKHVLEIGAAGGHVTQALIAQGCEVTAVEYDAHAAAQIAGAREVLVGDLNDASFLDRVAASGPYEVLLAGDVLEHVIDPLGVLRRCRSMLTERGFVVISLPNVAHADVALSLVSGRFDYCDVGLLDRTHLRFFTYETVRGLLADAGFVMTEVHRTICPIFGAGLGVDPDDYDAELVKSILARPDAETLQFVVRGVIDDGDAAVAALADRAIDAEERYRVARQEALVHESEAADLLGHSRALEAVSNDARLAAARSEAIAAELSVENEALRVHLQAIEGTKIMRLSKPVRRAWGKVRG